MGAKLGGRVALVTGSTSGIGKGVVQRFAADGASVVVTGLDTDDGESVAAEIRSRGGNAAFQFADLTVDREVENVVAFTIKTFGKLDIVVNNAGIVPRNPDGSMADGPVHRTEPDYWDRIWRADLRSIFMTCKAAVPYLLSSRDACVINIASVHAVQGCGMDVYSAIKAALIGFSRSMAVSYRHRIRVTSVSPGMVKVERTDHLWEKFPEMREQVRAAYPTRVGEPADVAALCAFLASKEGEFASGANYVLDGGMSAQGFEPPGPTEMREAFFVGDEPGL